MDFELTILGSNSAVPAYGRYPTAQVLSHHSEKFLIDCGEGAQFRMSHFKVKRSNLNHIFISHLHGDHYFGLAGLINSMRMSGREKPLAVFGPPKLKDILSLQMELQNPEWGFEVNFYPLNEGVSEHILTHNGVEVFTIPLTHKGMLCNGFLFKELPKQRKLKSSSMKEYQIPYTEFQKIKDGADYLTEEGQKLPNQLLTEIPPPAKSYAFCSDTVYDERIVPYVEGVNVLYHEATFMEAHKAKATERYHATAIQAATIAQKANVEKLIIGHFSARYKDLQPLLNEAKSVFPNTELAIEGATFTW